MFFAFNNPGQVTSIGVQLAGETADMVGVMGVTAPASVPLLAGIDDVSRKITTTFFDFAVDLFDKTVEGAKHRVDAAPQLPEVEVSYTSGDSTGGSHVGAHRSGFGK
ncbi:hypothetical protein OHA40_08420 [Nocardia sp. NBC_00508]|uniref:hypothetical protein n=1 Tax=Nocardia sp. NBC_00508 TaxID=2975992 RepID=UPI002E80A158|nr:hypothetical protein [Nocardia sp. NBC_00508]WUD68127.1 hypothetical protein OHA40_08420 [Nocardia sp. NBC_00508]